jgi:hypothetical protein
MEAAATFDDLFRHHPHYRRFQARPPEKKPRRPKPGANGAKRPARPKPAAPIAFLSTRIDLTAAPPVTVSGNNFIAELWPRGVLDVFSNEPVSAVATLNVNGAEALRHTFEVTAIAAGVVTLTGGGDDVHAVEADVFASRLMLDPWGELTPVERTLGSLLIKGRFGWSGECRTFPERNNSVNSKVAWPALTWTWRELIDLTPAVRAAPLLVLLANPA